MTAVATPPAKKDAANESGHTAHTGHASQQQQGLPGKMLRPIKVTMIGGASHFTHPLMNDILSIHGNRGGEIALVDTNGERLKPMTKVVRKLAEHYADRCDGEWKVTETTDREEVLGGTDYLLNSIDVGGVENVRHDNDIPLEYGIDQCIGDTMGPGGLFKALRTVPVWLDILRDARRLCPQAIVGNYTNPMSILCLAAARAVPEMPVVGLCHSTFLTLNHLCSIADVPVDEVAYRVGGINHLAWFTRLEHLTPEGPKDLYITLRPMVEHREGETYEKDPVRFDMMLAFGAFITESSGHLSEYLPYYRKTAETRKEYCRQGYQGGSSFYADNWPNWRKAQDEGRDKILRGEGELAKSRSEEYASWIIEAREKGTPCRIFGTMPNHDGSGRGRLISNLPSDGAVEVPIMVDRSGFNPVRFGQLPPQMAGICSTNMSFFDLAADACIEKSKEKAIHALMLDPLSAAVCTPKQIREMANQMFDAQEKFLGDYE